MDLRDLFPHRPARVVLPASGSGVDVVLGVVVGKLAPMKYSLRSLMIVVTLACVVLAGVMARVEYLRRMAKYHDRIANDVDSTLTDQDLFLAVNGQSSDETESKLISMNKHRRQAELFRRAVYRPWAIVPDLAP
jgi:hypothetical protein